MICEAKFPTLKSTPQTINKFLKDEEAKELQVQKIALDGIAVIVNTENQVTNLTSDQIKKIYTGDLTDWADVQ